ncbi:MAG: DUF2330 domain-containing protein [bacterium]|nr:DUF2330 domain-containing protein [bacterium]
MRTAIGTLMTMGLLLGLHVPVARACVSGEFTRPGQRVELTGRTRMLVTWDGEVERFVVDLAYQSDAKDFGAVFALPAQPNIAKAHEALFKELIEFTRPLPRRRLPGSVDVGVSRVKFGRGQTSAAGVSVIKEQSIGDFDVTTLDASDARALTEWLEDRDYVITDQDRENFRRAVAQRGTVFVAVRINATRARVSSSILGTYNTPPLAFAFRPVQPVIPLRLAADNDPTQRFSVWTIGIDPYVIPGAGLVFSGRVGRSTSNSAYPHLSPYLWSPAWMVAMEVDIDPTRIREDLALVPWDAPYEERVHYDDPLMFLMPNHVQESAGVVMSRSQLTITTAAYNIDVPPTLMERIIEFFWRWALLGMVLATFFTAHLFMARALHTLARHRGIPHRSWIAWIPLFNIDIARRIVGASWWWGVWSALPPAMLAIGWTSLVVAQFVYERNVPPEPDFYVFLTFFGVLFLLALEQAGTWVGLWMKMARSCFHSRWYGLLFAVPIFGAVLFNVMVALMIRTAHLRIQNNPPAGGILNDGV